jgi:hypothetical protein
MSVRVVFDRTAQPHRAACTGSSATGSYGRSHVGFGTARPLTSTTVDRGHNLPTESGTFDFPHAAGDSSELGVMWQHWSMTHDCGRRKQPQYFCRGTTWWLRQTTHGGSRRARRYPPVRQSIAGSARLVVTAPLDLRAAHWERPEARDYRHAEIQSGPSSAHGGPAPSTHR